MQVRGLKPKGALVIIFICLLALLAVPMVRCFGHCFPKTIVLRDWQPKLVQKAASAGEYSTGRTGASGRIAWHLISSGKLNLYNEVQAMCRDYREAFIEQGREIVEESESPGLQDSWTFHLMTNLGDSVSVIYFPAAEGERTSKLSVVIAGRVAVPILLVLPGPIEAMPGQASSATTADES